MTDQAQDASTIFIHAGRGNRQDCLLLGRSHWLTDLIIEQNYSLISRQQTALATVAAIVLHRPMNDRRIIHFVRNAAV